MADMSVNQDSLTLEETNRVRVSLGLKPIGGDDAAGDDGEPVVDLDAVAEANFAERRAEMKRAKAEEELKERMDKVKNQRALNAKLRGSTLGDTAKDDKTSAKDWIKAQKKRSAKREREIAERRAREMEEADRVAYDEGDLTGLKVAHDMDELETGEDIVLTLKDSRVLGGDEDELQNVNIADLERDKAAKERKRKAHAKYQGYDDEEFEEGRIGRKAGVLEKYDGEFDATMVDSEGFRLGAPVKKKAKVVEQEVTLLGKEPDVKVKLDLNFAQDFEVSDYMKEGDKGFKVKKRRAKKSSRRRDADDEGEGMDVDPNPTFAKRVVGDGPDNLVDDDDLQAALARSRRENAKRKPKPKPEDLAAKLAAQRAEDAAAVKEEEEDGEGDDGRITFDDTSEFVRNVTAESRATVKRERSRSRSQSLPAPPRSRSRSLSVAAAAGASKEPVVVKLERVDDEGDAEMESDDEEEDDELAELAAREGLSLAEYRQRIDAQMTELAELKPEDAVPEPEEKTAGMGMAGMLAMLRQQGTLSKKSTGDAERDRLQIQHDLWLADHRRRAAQRELERVAARGGNKDQAQREYDNRMREQNEAREALEAFKSYKPDVNIAYHDEFGRLMTPKEAWKSLSHKFHGKTSGRMKTEKRLRKIEEERRALAMAEGDTPTGMANAFARRQAKSGEAHMILSVGNKGNVQTDSKKR